MTTSAATPGTGFPVTDEVIRAEWELGSRRFRRDTRYLAYGFSRVRCRSCWSIFDSREVTNALCRPCWLKIPAGLVFHMQKKTKGAGPQ